MLTIAKQSPTPGYVKEERSYEGPGRKHGSVETGSLAKNLFAFGMMNAVAPNGSPFDPEVTISCGKNVATIEEGWAFVESFLEWASSLKIVAP